MMFHRIVGTGLPNVFLINGYALEEAEDEQDISYQDLDGLYEAIAAAIANRRAPLTGAEFRFLRRRAGLSQGQAGAMVDKTDQAVAKWEKGKAAVPVADGNMMRLAWLGKHSRRNVARAVDRMVQSADYDDSGDYMFVHDGVRWQEDNSGSQVTAAADEAAVAIQHAQLTSSSRGDALRYFADRLDERSEGMT